MSHTILTVIGARPQFIKAAAVSHAIAERPQLNEVLLHTGQHFDADMSDVFFSELGIPEPEYTLNIHGGLHGAMTGAMLGEVEKIMVERTPDMVLVYGDTNSTLAGALAAAKLHIPVAHVEAGLRSFNRAMPEEVNRVLTDHVSDLLLCLTTASLVNLKDEGIARGVYHVGDVMYDATLKARERAFKESTVLKRLDLTEERYVFATIHRAENTDDATTLDTLLDYLKDLAREHAVVLALHPRTRAAVERFGLSLAGIQVTAPLGYLDTARLLASCAMVVTDSGGLQKEAYFHQRPCVTLREETEWVETVLCGWNRLWREPKYAERKTIDEYGDGRAAQRVVDLLLEHIGARSAV